MVLQDCEIREVEQMRTILVLEANPQDALNMKRRLTAMGLRVHVATLVQQAIEFLQCEIFDGAVVGTELNIGEEPAISFLGRLPSVRFIVATGPPGDVEMERRARLAGARAYLPRPVTTESLTGIFRTSSFRLDRPASRWLAQPTGSLH